MHRIIIPESFPNLPSSIEKIQKMFAKDNLNSDMLAKILQEEPLLSANILKLVNSAHYGLNNQITSITHAVVLLGTTVIRGIVMAAVLKKSFPLNLSPYKISIEFFDKICILRVRLLKEWLKGNTTDMKTLFSAAFLMESGRIVMAHEILKHNLSNQFIELTKTNTLLDSEILLFNVDSYKVAALLFKQWNFDDNFTVLIAGVSNPTTYEQNFLHIISTAIGIDGILEESNITQASKLVEEYQFDLVKFTNAIKVIKKEM